MILKRTIQENIERSFFKGKVVILYGARQVGKTTLVKEIQKKFVDTALYLNGDEPDVRTSLSDATSTALRAYIGGKKFVVIDEAQRVHNIGLTLKLLVDNFPDIQVLATGSSSFELANSIAEPLTGRAYEFHLYPFSVEELLGQYSPIEMSRLRERQLETGMYPAVVEALDDEPAAIAKMLASNYLYKDVLSFQNIRKPEILEKLLQALALQMGNEVSFTELAQLVGANKETVENYVRVLEQAFIVFRLPPFFRNPRKELSKMRKIYFWDVGMRNAIINNFNPMGLRPDVGALWENFLMSERLKFLSNHQYDHKNYFWRTTAGQEIDLIEEGGGHIRAFEFKWSSQKLPAKPARWAKEYPEAPFAVISPETYLEFLTRLPDEK